MLMVACVIVTLAFRTTEKIGHAYGKQPGNSISAAQFDFLKSL
jgi:KUP system potassium uptake protein